MGLPFRRPLTITTDRGAQFESRLFAELTRFLGTTRIRTTSCHPAANGLVERFHRQLKAALFCHAHPERWLLQLPLVLLGVRSALKPDVGCSPAELVYGCGFRLPGEFFSPQPQSSSAPANIVSQLRQFADNLRPVPTCSARANQVFHLPAALDTCSHVYLRHDAIRKALQPPYDGPYKVLSRSAKNMTLEVKGKPSVVTIDRVKPAFVAISAVLPSAAAAPPAEPAVLPVRLPPRKKVSWKC